MGLQKIEKERKRDRGSVTGVYQREVINNFRGEPSKLLEFLKKKMCAWESDWVSNTQFAIYLLSELRQVA